MHYKTNFKRTKKLSCPYNVIVIFKEYLNKIVDIYYRLTSINNIYTLLKYNILIHYFFENYIGHTGHLCIIMTKISERKTYLLL